MRTAGLCALSLAACAPALVPPVRGSAGPAPSAGPRASSAPPSASASASQNPPPPAPPPLPTGDIGGAYPTLLGSASAGGYWAAVCQATSDTNGDGQVAVTLPARGAPAGDLLAPRLVTGSGAGEPLDDLLAADPTGRRVIVRRESAITLLDAFSAERVDLATLGVDARRDARPRGPHRAFAFGESGERLALVLRDAERSRAALWRASGALLRSDRDFPEIASVTLAAGEQWLVISAIEVDTDRDGRFEWPVPLATSARPLCAAPSEPYVSWTGRGDAATTFVASASDGHVQAAPDLVTPLGAALLVRGPRGELTLRTASGSSTELWPAECGARVLYADATRGLVLGTCKDARGKPLLELADPAGRTALNVALGSQPSDSMASSGARWVAVNAAGDTVLVDLQRRRARVARRGDAVLATHGARAVLLRGTQLVLWDADDDGEHVIAEGVDAIPRWLAQGDAVYASPWVVRLSDATAWRVSARVIALTERGATLQGQSDAWPAQGPLSWHPPGG